MRLFIAINLPDEWKETLSKPMESIAWIGKGVHWVEPKGMHLTLKFLGDVEREQVDTLTDALKPIAEVNPGFHVRIAGTGAFPSPRRPRVFWAGISAPEELLHLQHRIDEATQLLGFPAEDREFKPHLTVARIKDPLGKKRITDAFLRFKIRSEPFHVECFSLMRSHLKSDGARYEELVNFPLAPDSVFTL
jgi:RNA 2',3'-cyclic 3'-phosphodiesterase